MRRFIADLITDLEVFKKEYDQQGSKYLAKVTKKTPFCNQKNNGVFLEKRK